jgi:hypothetical protein
MAWGILLIAAGASCGGRTPTTGEDIDGGPTGSGNGVGGAGGVVTTGTGGGTTVGTTGTGGGSTGTGGAGATGGSGGSGATGGAGGAGPEWDTCTGPGQCELAPTRCCTCGILGLDQLAAINSSKRDAFSKQVCGTMPQPCPPCVGVIDPHLMARCESGRCRGFDVRNDPTYTKCGSDQECVLRKGLACCECQAPGDWVAVSRVGTMMVSSEACGPNSVCPGCVPVPPAGISAACRNGICLRIPQ